MSFRIVLVRNLWIVAQLLGGKGVHVIVRQNEAACARIHAGVIETARMPGSVSLAARNPADVGMHDLCRRGPARRSIMGRTHDGALDDLRNAGRRVLRHECRVDGGFWPNKPARGGGAVSCVPGTSSEAATSTPLITMRGPGAAAVGGVPPP